MFQAPPDFLASIANRSRPPNPSRRRADCSPGSSDALRVTRGRESARTAVRGREGIAESSSRSRPDSAPSSSLPVLDEQSAATRRKGWKWPPHDFRSHVVWRDVDPLLALAHA